MILQHTSALYTYLLTYIWWISTKCGETVGNPDTWHSTFEPCGLIFHLLDLKINPEWQCLKIIACTKFGDREFNRLIIFFIPSTRIRSYIVRQAAEIAISDGDKANRPQSRFYASFDCAGNRFTTYADFHLHHERPTKQISTYRTDLLYTCNYVSPACTYTYLYLHSWLVVYRLSEIKHPEAQMTFSGRAVHKLRSGT